MTTGIWILGDQLLTKQSSLQSCKDIRQDVPILLIEAQDWVQERLYHRQKLVLVWSAMRHFAQELEAEGWKVSYEVAKDFASSLQTWIKEHNITELRIMSPKDRPFREFINHLDLDCEVTFTPNNLFLWDVSEFEEWLKPRKRLVMEDFYREGRTRFEVLMEGKQPVGEKWNLDQQNRKPPKKGLNPPDPLWFEPDEITQEVIAIVDQFETYGEIQPFRWGVNRSQALEVLDYFIEERLPDFGTYQDAMLAGEETLWHAMLSPYLNLGLLHPLEVIDAAEKAFHERELPLNSVEGFIRQILGWREYLHCIYHHVDADYFQGNWFNHTRPLPKFYWDASQTKMNCLSQVLSQVEGMGYAHHIQRLMILSNFALISGVSPQEIENWFHSAFIDAYDWVMQTNVIGMGQFADGGFLASKPYAASANYINKMSDYCQGCEYNYRDRVGKNACPFNFFYWDFLSRHQDKLKSQGRMNLVLSHLKKMSDEDLGEIQSLAQQWWES